MSGFADALPAESVREELDRILSSPDFDGTDRVHRFLTYVVEEKLDGREDRIKAYNIATSVFGRDKNFDPQLDSIVRMAAGRMRRSIERYYLTSGRHDRVEIRIPKGGYVPSFAVRDEHYDAPGGRDAGCDHGTPTGSTVVVEPIVQESGRSAWPEFATGLTRLLIINLSRYHGLSVYAPPIGRRAIVPGDGNYALGGAISVENLRLEADLVLTDVDSGRIVWADCIVAQLEGDRVFAFRDELASTIARKLGDLFGVINSDRMRSADIPRGPRADSRHGARDGILDFYRYWSTFDDNLAGVALRRLERVTRLRPDDAEAVACLSLTYSNLDQLTGQTVVPEQGLSEQAFALAERAVSLAPVSSWSHYALALAHWARRDVAASIDSFEVAHALNPNDTCIAADLGQRYAMLAHWDRARSLIGEAFTSNPALPGTLRIGPFLYHFAQGRFACALSEACKISHNLTFAFAATAAAAIRLGQRDVARDAIRQLRTRDPTYGIRIAADLERRNVDEDLACSLVAALREAGLSELPVGGIPPSARFEVKRGGT